jgi:hypothetical protein
MTTTSLNTGSANLPVFQNQSWDNEHVKTALIGCNDRLHNIDLEFTSYQGKVDALRTVIKDSNDRIANACAATGAIISAAVTATVIFFIPDPFFGSTVAIKTTALAAKATAIVAGSALAGAGGGWIIGQAFTKTEKV